MGGEDGCSSYSPPSFPLLLVSTSTLCALQKIGGRKTSAPLSRQRFQSSLPSPLTHRPERHWGSCKNNLRLSSTAPVQFVVKRKEADCCVRSVKSYISFFRATVSDGESEGERMSASFSFFFSSTCGVELMHAPVCRSLCCVQIGLVVGASPVFLALYFFRVLCQSHFLVGRFLTTFT